MLFEMCDLVKERITNINEHNGIMQVEPLNSNRIPSNIYNMTDRSHLAFEYQISE